MAKDTESRAHSGQTDFAGYVSAQGTLETGCELYCKWYDTGHPQMSGKDIAYEMVSFMRKALSEMKAT